MQKLVIAAALPVAFPASALAAGNTSTASGAASAAVVAPLVLTHDPGASLNFGKFTTGAGQYLVTPASIPLMPGNINLIGGSMPSSDTFTVTGDDARSFTISTTNGTVTNGAVTIPFATNHWPATTGTLVGGKASFSVGGTLTLTGTEPAGTYSGTYSATVTYN